MCALLPSDGVSNTLFNVYPSTQMVCLTCCLLSKFTLPLIHPPQIVFSFCVSNTAFNVHPSPQMVFSFCDKLFGLMIKDIEAMDPSILKGEPASGKKQKVQLIT